MPRLSKDEKKMKKILLLGMAAIATGMLSCGAKQERTAPDDRTAAVEQKERTFRLPEVPVMLTDPEQRAVYVANHYWEHFDFRDTVYIHLPDITEQAAVNFMDLLPRVPQEEALNSLKTLMEKASAEPRMLYHFWETLYRYWHDPNSPMKNEDMFILLCKGVEQTPQTDEVLKARAAYLRRLAEKNRVGQTAADFVYTLPSGKQGSLYGLKAPYTLLFFYNPDCHTCAEIKQTMRRSLLLKDKVSNGQMKVLTVYPDEDVELWRDHLNEMASEWVNGYDKGQVLTVEQRYDLSSIPSFYLLDKDKKVLLKDADWNEVMRFFENNPL